MREKGGNFKKESLSTTLSRSILFCLYSRYGKRRKNWYIKRGFQFYFAEAKSVTYIHDGDEKKRAEWTISDPEEDMDFVTKDGTQMYVNDLYCKTAKDEIREFKFKMGSVNVKN